MKSESSFERFCCRSPFAVMTQVVLRACIRDCFSQSFEKARGRQYEGVLTFENLAIAVADVALGICKNPNQAYRAHKEDLNVARSRFYGKIHCTSTQLSQQIVADTAIKVAEMQDALGISLWVGISGYRLLAIDGNHLEKTEKRLEVLRGTNVAPLPGTAVCRFDLGRQIFDRVYLLEDAHHQESATCDSIVADLLETDVIVADRHYCIVAFMNQIANKRSGFIIRQHGRLQGELIGKRKLLGKSSTGVVYEQQMRLSSNEDALVVRRITVELYEPTQEGEMVIHVLTNLPPRVCGKLIAEQYHRRWEEETGYYYVRMCFNGELSSIGHPRAALLLFSLTVIAYNILQVIMGALFATHEEEEVNSVSNLYVSKEIASVTPGMLIALDDDCWEQSLPDGTRKAASLLKQIAKEIDLSLYKKSKRKPNEKRNGKQKARKKRNARHSHASTAKLLGLTDP